MAEDHLATIRRIRPTGPYLLGGYCNGAMIAYEMARRLTGAGEHVPSVLMVEPPLVPPSDAPYQGLLPLSPAQMRDPRIRGPWLFTRYVALVMAYQLQPHAGDVVVFWAAEGPPNRTDPRTALSPFTSTVTVYDVPGGHTAAVGRHVRRVAAAMRDHLTELLAA
jgi:thioesterase domain-containing protein